MPEGWQRQRRRQPACVTSRPKHPHLHPWAAPASLAAPPLPAGAAHEHGGGGRRDRGQAGPPLGLRCEGGAQEPSQDSVCEGELLGAHHLCHQLQHRPRQLRGGCNTQSASAGGSSGSGSSTSTSKGVVEQRLGVQRAEGGVGSFPAVCRMPLPLPLPPTAQPSPTRGLPCSGTDPPCRALDRTCPALRSSPTTTSQP